MSELHQLEIVINLFLQSLGSWLALPMRAVSFLGTEEFYLMIMPALFWCISPALGLRTALILLLSSAANASLKILCLSPRPYWINPHVRALAAESSFGLPSGHSQNAAAIWGWLGKALRRPWAGWAAGLVIVLIGFSRLYLGVHFLSDVLSGWLLGGLTLLLFTRLDAPVTAWARQASFQRLLLSAAGGAVLIAALIAIPGLALQNWPIPAEWSANALAAVPDEPIAPLNINAAFSLSGIWLGLTAGAAWIERKKGGYTTAGSVDQKILRYIVGLIGVLVLWYGLGKIFPRDPDLISYGLRFIRYSLAGAWIAAWAPLIFIRLRLSR